MMNISAGDYQSISEKCKAWAKKNLGDNFIFRDFQLDCIVNIVYNVISNIKTQVCEAPTGTGKSLMAFISAGVLADYYDKSTYILCSDTALFKQYEEDIQRYHLDFGCVCGKDNYSCKQNGLSFSNSSCQHAQVSIRKLVIGDLKKKAEKFANCSQNCKYINALRIGHKAKVTVLTYQLWFSASEDGLPEDFMFGPFWKQRDLVICDEAHKLPEIVQNLFSPKIDMDETTGIDMMIKFAELRDCGDVPERRHFEEVFNVMSNIMNDKSYASEGKRSHDMFVCLKRWGQYLDDLSVAYYTMQADMEENKHIKGIDYDTYSKAGTAFSQEHIVCNEYLQLIQNLGEQWVVPSKLNDHTIIFNCAREADMVKTFFHNRTKAEFLMSATIGNLDNYRTMISSDDDPDFTAFEADNGFDFSRSPIYYNENLRLSYREKEKNLPMVMKQIEDICSNHKSLHGIIQTGSYEFGKYLWEHASPSLQSRLVFYNNASERKRAIQMYQDMYGKILIGPSLLEGLNFEGDLCRFIIVMKVPYASLADNLVKAKMAVYPEWYTNDVINKMVQGVGRGVRSKDDWCETYIVDGCWNDVLTRSSNLMPEKFVERMKKL